jgi:Trp operon repressor
MKKINELLHKEMTRKEFLATLGFGVATLLGFSSALKLITGRENPLEQQSNTPLSYGGGTYGGRKI